MVQFAKFKVYFLFLLLLSPFFQHAHASTNECDAKLLSIIGVLLEQAEDAFEDNPKAPPIDEAKYSFGYKSEQIVLMKKTYEVGVGLYPVEAHILVNLENGKVKTVLPPTYNASAMKNIGTVYEYQDTLHVLYRDYPSLELKVNLLKKDDFSTVSVETYDQGKVIESKTGMLTILYKDGTNQKLVFYNPKTGERSKKIYEISENHAFEKTPDDRFIVIYKRNESRFLVVNTETEQELDFTLPQTTGAKNVQPQLSLQLSGPSSLWVKQGSTNAFIFDLNLNKIIFDLREFLLDHELLEPLASISKVHLLYNEIQGRRFVSIHHQYMPTVLGVQDLDSKEVFEGDRLLSNHLPWFIYKDQVEPVEMFLDSKKALAVVRKWKKGKLELQIVKTKTGEVMFSTQEKGYHLKLAEPGQITFKDQTGATVALVHFDSETLEFQRFFKLHKKNK